MKTLFAALAILLLIAAPVAAQTEKKAAETGPPASELTPDVPALDAFHEVIFQLWHTAYPAQDTTMMLVLYPKIHENIVALNDAKLPGILRDKTEAWKNGLDRLHAAEMRYGAALSSHNKEALLKAAEDLHKNFEMMVRIIRPVLPELADFHSVLYQIYHYDLPKKDLASLRTRLPALQAEMDTLGRAELPKRNEAKREDFLKARAELQQKVQLVSESAKKDDWATVETSVEEMHTAYKNVEKVFD